MPKFDVSTVASGYANYLWNFAFSNQTTEHGRVVGPTPSSQVGLIRDECCSIAYSTIYTPYIEPTEIGPGQLCIE